MTAPESGLGVDSTREWTGPLQHQRVDWAVTAPESSLALTAPESRLALDSTRE